MRAIEYEPCLLLFDAFGWHNSDGIERFFFRVICRWGRFTAVWSMREKGRMWKKRKQEWVSTLIAVCLVPEKTKAKINPHLLAFLNCNSNCKLGECVTECRERVRGVVPCFGLMMITTSAVQFRYKQAAENLSRHPSLSWQGKAQEVKDMVNKQQPRQTLRRCSFLSIFSGSARARFLLLLFLLTFSLTINLFFFSFTASFLLLSLAVFFILSLLCWSPAHSSPQFE